MRNQAENEEIWRLEGAAQVLGCWALCFNVLEKHVRECSLLPQAPLSLSLLWWGVWS